MPLSVRSSLPIWNRNECKSESDFAFATHPLCLSGILSLTDCNYANDTLICGTHWHFYCSTSSLKCLMNPRLIGSSKLICDLICGQEVHADLDKGETNDSRLSLRFKKIWSLVARDLKKYIKFFKKRSASEIWIESKIRQMHQEFWGSREHHGAKSNPEIKNGNNFCCS